MFAITVIDPLPEFNARGFIHDPAVKVRYVFVDLGSCGECLAAALPTTTLTGCIIALPIPKTGTKFGFHKFSKNLTKVN